METCQKYSNLDLELLKNIVKKKPELNKALGNDNFIELSKKLLPKKV